MNNLPLQPLVWGVDEYTGEPVSNSLLHGYIVMNDGNSKFKVAYYLLSGGTYTKFATGFATIDEAKQWAWNHYNEKMQPYVKPLPTWIDAKKQLPKVDVDTQFICAYDSALEPYVRVATFSVEFGDFGAEYEGVLAWMPIPSFKEIDCD